jgi:hypothetical protein
MNELHVLKRRCWRDNRRDGAGRRRFMENEYGSTGDTILLSVGDATRWLVTGQLEAEWAPKLLTE